MKLNLKLKISDILFTITMVFVLSFPNSSRIKAIPIIAFFCYMMAIKVLKHKTIKNTLQIVGLFLFLGYCYMSRKWALYPQAVSEQLNNVLWTVLLSTAISSYVVHRDFGVEDIAKRMVPIALLFFINVVLNHSFVDNRLSIGINENAFGRLSSGLACFVLYQCKQEKWGNIPIDIITAILFLFTLLSGSRTAVLILGLYTIAFLFFEHPNRNSMKMFKNIALAMVLCVVGYACVTRISFLYNTVGYRIEDLLKLLGGVSEGDGSAITRMNMMNRAKEIFLKNPCVGVGLNNFKYATYHNTYAHNNYYELAACLGIVGLVVYYLPLVIYLLRAMRKWRRDEVGMIVPLAILGALVLGDIGSVSYFDMLSHAFVGFAIGLLSRRCYDKNGAEKG